MDRNGWDIYFLNVGDGDCIYIADRKQQCNLLIDAGPHDPQLGGRYPYRLSAAQFLASIGVQEISVLVSTHFHEDHAGGLADVLNGVAVREFWCNYYPPSYFWNISCAADAGWCRESKMMAAAVRDFQHTLDTISQKKIPITVIGDGVSRRLTPGAVLTGLYPGERERRQYDQILRKLYEATSEAAFAQAMKTLNGISLILRFDILLTTVLLPSDPGVESFSSESLCPCSLLKLAHHGGNDGSSAEQLRQMAPMHVVITAAKDSPEFPGRQTLALLQSLRTETGKYKLHPVDSGDQPYLHFVITENGCQLVEQHE
jgi:competence protein ComEC